MPANIEVKARVSNPIETESQLRSIVGDPTATLEQEDVFYSVSKGRLKMRCENPTHCELIYYTRPNEPGPTMSSYFRRIIDNPEQKREELVVRFGVRSIVKKHRLLFLLEGSRIHLDNVSGLGYFIEIEVPIHSSLDTHLATARAKKLMKLLSIQDSDLLHSAYDDLLAAQGDKKP